MKLSALDASFASEIFVRKVVPHVDFKKGRFSKPHQIVTGGTTSRWKREKENNNSDKRYNDTTLRRWWRYY